METEGGESPAALVAKLLCRLTAWPRQLHCAQTQLKPLLLVPLTVAEEGIDVKSCQLVVRYDLPDTAQVRRRVCVMVGGWDGWGGGLRSTLLPPMHTPPYTRPLSRPACRATSSHVAGRACSTLSCC